MSNPNPALLTSLLRDGMHAGHMPYLRVSSGSMRPLLQVGDEVGLQPVTLEQLQPGDIVVMTDRDQILTHRFCTLKNTGRSPAFLTRGDRVLSYDKLWTADQLLGRVVARRRQDRTLWLDYGPGRWLNKTLSWVSRYEGQILNLSPSQPGPSHRSLVQELVRLSLRSLAEALARVVDAYAYRRTGSRLGEAHRTGRSQIHSCQ